MTTTTTEPTVVVDVDLDKTPTCEMGEMCAGEQGPAVALAKYFDLPCDHDSVTLICAPCVARFVAYVFAPFSFVCGVCKGTHKCFTVCHVKMRPL